MLEKLFCTTSSLFLSPGASEADELVREGILNTDNYELTEIYTSNQSGEFCENMTIEHSLLIKPRDEVPRAMIGCKETRDQHVYINVTKDMTLINIDVRNIRFNVTGDLNMTLTLVNCEMINTRIGLNSQNVSRNTRLQIVNTTFRGHLLDCAEELDCGSSSQLWINSTNLTLWYQNNTFLQTQQFLKTVSANKVSDLSPTTLVVTFETEKINGKYLV